MDRAKTPHYFIDSDPASNTSDSESDSNEKDMPIISFLTQVTKKPRKFRFKGSKRHYTVKLNAPDPQPDIDDVKPQTFDRNEIRKALPIKGILSIPSQ